ncbi:MAG: VTT domain-containing protein [Kiritimatiellia bacterium]
MTDASFFGLYEHLTGNPWLLGLIITLGVCFLEDPGRCVVGLLVATGDISWWLAFTAMIAGSLLGDFGLYLIGRYAIIFCINLRWINAERVEQMQGYFSQHAIKALVAARFLPGARTFAYITAGVTHYGIIKFLVILTGAAVAQALIFLYATGLIGERFLIYLENKNMRWAAVGMILAVIIAVHFVIKKMKKNYKKN